VPRKQNIGPAYAQIADDLCQRIATHRLERGERLTEAQLTVHYRTSRPTLRKALARLSQRGLICQIPGRGTFVTDPKTMQGWRKTEAGFTGLDQAIAVLLPCVTGSNYPGILRGVEDVAQRANRHVLLGNCDVDPAREQAYMERYAAGGVAGLIVAAGYNSAENPFYGELTARRIPFVLVDTSVPGVQADFVATDGWKGARAGTRRLIEQGCRRIAFVSGQITVAPERFDGYKAALADAGLPVDPALIRIGQHTAAFAAEAACDLLRDKRVDGFMLASESMLRGLMSVLREAGRRVQDRLCVAGFGGLAMLSSGMPLTLLIEPGRMVGQEAARLLLERIQATGDTTLPFRTVLIAPPLVDSAAPDAEQEIVRLSGAAQYAPPARSAGLPQQAPRRKAT